MIDNMRSGKPQEDVNGVDLAQQALTQRVRELELQLQESQSNEGVVQTIHRLKHEIGNLRSASSPKQEVARIQEALNQLHPQQQGGSSSVNPFTDKYFNVTEEKGAVDEAIRKIAHGDDPVSVLESLQADLRERVWNAVNQGEVLLSLSDVQKRELKQVLEEGKQEVNKERDVKESRSQTKEGFVQDSVAARRLLGKKRNFKKYLETESPNLTSDQIDTFKRELEEGTDEQTLLAVVDRIRATANERAKTSLSEAVVAPDELSELEEEKSRLEERLAALRNREKTSLSISAPAETVVTKNDLGGVEEYDRALGGYPSEIATHLGIPQGELESVRQYKGKAAVRRFLLSRQIETMKGILSPGEDVRDGEKSTQTPPPLPTGERLKDIYRRAGLTEDGDAQQASSEGWERQAVEARARGAAEAALRPPPLPQLDSSEIDDNRRCCAIARRFAKQAAGVSENISSPKNPVKKFLSWLKGEKDSPHNELEKRLREHYPEHTPKPSEMARALARAGEEEGLITKDEAADLGLAESLYAASKWYQERFTFKRRVAIGALLIGGSVVATAAIPPLVGAVGSAAFLWRIGTSAATGIGAGALVGKHLKNKNHDAVFVSHMSGLTAGITTCVVFVGGSALGEYLQPYMQSYLESGGSAVPDVPKSILAMPELPAPAEALPAPPEVPVPQPAYRVPDVILNPQPLDGTPAMPESIVAPEPVVIEGNVGVWSALTDGIAERGLDLSDRGQEAFAHAVQAAVDKTGTQGAFIEKGGVALSGVPWDRIPDGARVHFDTLFANDAFMNRLSELLSSSEYKTLGGEIARSGDTVSSFLEKATSAYGAR